MLDMEPSFNPTSKKSPDRTANAIRLVALVATIPALAIAYYFGIALPAYNESRLALERQQVAEDRKKSAQVAKDAEARKELLEACLQKANDDWLSYLKLNGTELKGGRISTPQYVATAADKRKTDDRDTCLKRYGGR